MDPREFLLVCVCGDVDGDGIAGEDFMGILILTGIILDISFERDIGGVGGGV